MTFQDDVERERRRKADDDDDAAAPARASRPRKRKSQPTEVGDALRSVYQRTIAEDIPPEMLDLLGKLG